MKCKNCGAPLTMTQKFCPNCGSPNEQSKEHIADMNRYQKEFSKTRNEVVSNSKWFVKYITPITVFAISIIIGVLFWSCKEGLLGYKLADRAKKRYNSSHQEEISTRMNSLLDNKEYYALYSIQSNMNQIFSKERYDTKWSNFYDLAREYSELRKNMMIYYDTSLADSYSYTSAINYAAGNIVSIEQILNGRYAKKENAPEAVQPINEMKNAYQTFLQVYCNFTEEDIAGLSDQDQTAILSLFMRRVFHE